MELGRFKQIADLREKGWTTDEETAMFHAMDARDMRVGGPSYMKSPEGVLCAVSGGTERPVAGRFALVEIAGTPRYTVYEGGRPVYAQG